MYFSWRFVAIAFLFIRFTCAFLTTTTKIASTASAASAASAASVASATSATSATSAAFTLLAHTRVFNSYLQF